MRRHLKYAYVLFFMLSLVIKNNAQVSLSGIITDISGAPLPGVTIKIMDTDSSMVKGVSSDNTGKFETALLLQKKYILKFVYISYRDLYKNVEVGSESLNLGKIILKEDAKTLSEVEIKTLQTRGVQKGDTTQFNADAFKTNPDATAEDLVKKMPGVTSDNNGVKVNGESVQKVLVDGKPFFGDDANAALKNIPSEIIDKVEIFDKMSDQSSFTGFSDGNQQKTINLVTKKGKNVGMFGKVYGGGGEDEEQTMQYNAGATLNSFNNKRRISLLLLSNNINQQNFSSSDITGAMSNSGQSGGRGGRPGSSSGSNSLLTAAQNGNTATQSAGLNYSDDWGKKITVSGSYFFNYSDNKNASIINRTYFTNNDLSYKQANNNQSLNQNQRFNFRFEYNIDSSNKIIITPALTFQNNLAKSYLLGSNTISDTNFLSKTNSYSKIANVGYDFSNNVLYQHKFRKIGRTASLTISNSLSERNNNGYYVSNNDYYNDTLSSISALDQQYIAYSNSKTISPNLSFTEPLNKNAQIQISYNPSFTQNLSNKRTNDSNLVTGVFDNFNTPLSNKYDNTYEIQKAGLGYKYRKDKLNFSVGSDIQQSTLKGDQTFPIAVAINPAAFQNILPNAMLNYRFSKTKNLRIYYRSNTNIPSTTQLQSVIDISNPLQITSGNTGLKQTFENNLNIRFGGFNPTTSRNAMVFLNANYTDNYISNATYLLNSDTIIQNYTIKAGSQLTKPVNLNGYYMARCFFTYGFPVKSLKSNLNINGGLNHGHTPTLINNVQNYSNSYATNGGVYIGSNVSQNLDFSLGYNGNYTFVKNSVQKKSDNSYFTHTATFKLNWIFLKGFVFNTDVNHTLYNGLSQSFNQQYFLWNAYFGYKFLKNKSLEAKVSVFDILNQNRSISRTITGSYTEDNNTSVLRRYALLTVTYTFKKIKTGAVAPQVEPEYSPFRGDRPPGMPPRGGPN